MDANICQQITLTTFSNEAQLNWISAIMRKQLAQPYSLFTYTNFLVTWPHLAVMAYHNKQIIGCIIGSYDTINPKKSYIAMLVVQKQYRRHKVGKKLFQEFYRRVKQEGATKIVLQTQCCNHAALKFYLGLGFFKTRRMLNYYLSGNDAFRLKLYIPENQNNQNQTKMTEVKDKKQQNKNQVLTETQSQSKKQQKNQ